MQDTKTEPAANDKKSKKAEESQKTDVKFQSMMPLEEAVSYFEAIVAGMKKGLIHFKQDDESLKLNPPSHLSVEVRAGSKKDKQKISFELEWQTVGDQKLSISAE